MTLSKYIDLLYLHFLTLNGHYIEMPQSNCLFCQRMSADKGTSIEVHDNDNQENDEENDPITNLTKIMAEHIKTETNDTE